MSRRKGERGERRLIGNHRAQHDPLGRNLSCDVARRFRARVEGASAGIQ